MTALFVFVCVCAGWGLNNKAVCAVLLSDLLQFRSPLLLPRADIEGERWTKGGELEKENRWLLA